MFGLELFFFFSAQTIPSGDTQAVMVCGWECGGPSGTIIIHSALMVWLGLGLSPPVRAAFSLAMPISVSFISYVSLNSRFV